MSRDTVYTTVALQPDTHVRLKRVLEHMKGIDRRVSTFDACISELVLVYEHASSINKVCEEDLDDDVIKGE